MERRVSQQPAWLIHQRPYRENSLLLEFLTRDFGRVSGVSRGARRRGKGHTRIAQFVPFQVCWTGGGALKTMIAIEPESGGIHLVGNHLAGGLYLNELLMRSLRPHDACEPIYTGYSSAVRALGAGAGLQPTLRDFESQLLLELGYGLSFTHCLDGMQVNPGACYRLDGLNGFRKIPAGMEVPEAIEGFRLLEIARGEYGAVETRKLARRIFQSALAPHIGTRPLQSRRLLRSGRSVVAAPRTAMNFPSGK